MYHKILHDGIYYFIKYIDQESKEELTAWKKSEELMCANIVYNYWKAPHQYTDDISLTIKNTDFSASSKKEEIKILGLSPINDQLVLLVRFPDSDTDQLIDSKEFRRKYPNELIEFYRSHAVTSWKVTH